ncbi:hypothetical protein BZA03_110201 [Alteromonas sp. I10]|uniref:trypco2 family protein n=1 Tax=Alteromonas TaxID=226 RepID=UPI000D76CC63|nr:trypco2 family protein [Alteromonas sp. I10]PXW70022.1 hypothetical protein BZA03_110201 [Alteromonas sp. I10]
MELKDFVKESLVQISKGIEEANAELADSEAMINPVYVKMHTDNAQAYGRTKSRDPKHDLQPDSRIVQKVDFDVAVVVESGQQGSAEAKLSIASIGIGGGGKTESSNKSESRIKFSIPVVLPGCINER